MHGNIAGQHAAGVGTICRIGVSTADLARCRIRYGDSRRKRRAAGLRGDVPAEGRDVAGSRDIDVGRIRRTGLSGAGDNALHMDKVTTGTPTRGAQTERGGLAV